MTEPPVDPPPDPRAAPEPAEFVRRLRELRAWAGEPALRRLRQLAGATVDSRGRRIDALPVSTTSHVLRAGRLPRMEFVRAFVTACLRARGRCQEEIEAQLERWHDAWLSLSRQRHPADPGSNPGSGPARQVVPRQLPADVSGLVGREVELARLEALREPEPGSPAIWVIDGPAGAGKSTLAVHAAHRLVGAFPDGQLYVNLRDATVGLAPLEPAEVLGRFLRALGSAGATVPGQVDEAGAQFRTQVAGRRLLLVLDNARDEAQVRPLLPGTPGCGVLVTARRPLSGLAGARHLHLGVLPEPAAVELLAGVAGPDRVAAEPAAAAEVVRWCGHLPLALHIAGARLAARPGWSVSVLAGRLADERRRLTELEVARIGVRTSFGLSYRQLRDSDDPADRAAAEAFGLLGMWDGPDLAVAMAARLLDRSRTECERLLERLVDARLLESGASGRYRFHDLLRLYARECATRSVSAPHRVAAIDRALRHYTATAWRTLALIRPGDPRLSLVEQRWSGGGLELAGGNAAMCWLDAERSNLIAAVDQAAATEPLAPAAIQLARALFGYFHGTGLWSDCVRVNQTALAVAERLGDLTAQAHTHNDIGGAHHLRGRYRDALPHILRSLELHRETGDRLGEARTLSNLGIVYAHVGSYQEAVDALQASMDIREALGDWRGYATSLNNLGLVQGQHGHHAQALQSLRRSLRLNRDLGYRWGVANCLDSLGLVHHRQGQYAEALRCYGESLTIRRQLEGNHRYLEADTLRNVGETLAALGREEEAKAHWREALGIYDQLQISYADELRTRLQAGPAPRLTSAVPQPR